MPKRRFLGVYHRTFFFDIAYCTPGFRCIIVGIDSTVTMVIALDQFSRNFDQQQQSLPFSASQSPHHAWAAYQFQWISRCEYIANAIEASTGFSFDVGTVPGHLSDLYQMLRETIQEAENQNNLVMRLLAQLQVVDGHRRHDCLYRFLDTEAVWHNFGCDMQGFEVLIRSCSVGFRRAIKTVRVQIPPSVMDVSRYLRPLMCSRGVELRLLQVGFSSGFIRSQAKYKGKRWLEEMGIFLDEVADGEIDVVLEINSVRRSKGFNETGQAYPTALLKRRGWRARISGGHKWEASTKAKR